MSTKESQNISETGIKTAQPTNEDFQRFANDISKALLIRKVENRLLGLFAEGDLFGTVHTCIGQEFSAVAVGRNFQEVDTVFSNHRGHGHYLSYCDDVEGLIAEVMGKKSGVCGGRGGSQHLQRDNYFSNGIQGGIVPVAAGLAMSLKRKNNGGVSVVFIGDGTLGQGAVYESLNIASKWSLPLLVVCDNNLYAQSTCQTQTLSGDICHRARAFDIKSFEGNTWDWIELFSTVEEAFRYVRDECKPAFLRIDTFRLMAHSKGDDNRPEDYVAKYEAIDPLNLIEQAFGDDNQFKQISTSHDARIEEAVRIARTDSFGNNPQFKSDEIRPEWKPLQFDDERVVASVHRSLHEVLEKDDSIVVFGEDIEGPYGGAFKCTKDLSQMYPGRVLNTPISELAITGIANGLALGGDTPVLEIMFGDFMTLACDQWINHAAKFQYMYNDKVTVPIVIRTPMGGKRGYASTHSQSLEKHFVGLPGTRVLCLHHRYPPADLYRSLFEDVGIPTLVVENKILYGKRVSSKLPPGFELVYDSNDRFPTVWLRPRCQAELTIVALGSLSLEAEQAANRLFVENEIASEVLMPSQLYPFNLQPVLESVRRTRKLIVVEEGQSFASVSAEIVAQVNEALPNLAIRSKRVTAKPYPIPAARPLEEDALPGAQHIIEAAVEIANVDTKNS